MSQTDSTPNTGMSRSQLIPRAVCIVATGTIWVLTVFGIAILGIAVATSPAGQLNIRTMLCIVPVAVSTCLGLRVLSNGVHRRLLSLFDLEPIQRSHAA
ncbi:hypothetical protein [Burkholderia stabilis]|uniref:hypothetical protein n=1 Tax=Burkholderia stabilis TaxID=95485 RepID=UPI001F4BA6BF|nr:hypothetical protein [Burkholderia stabilis]